MSPDEYDVLNTALSVMTKGPMPLAVALSTAPTLAGLKTELTVETLFRRLSESNARDALRNRFRESLVAWDFQLEGEWTGDTVRNTLERRHLIYDKLGLDNRFRRLLDETLPFAPQDPVIVVAREFTPWYDAERRLAHNFYWSKYKEYLTAVRGFAPENVETLDESTTAIIERLADPEQVEAYQSKGLVVGYVQSGKTANFTGVIAKAIDAGYRLIIVLSGTTDLLRDQTQRRLDMELVGKEQITRHHNPGSGDRHDYDDDPQWDSRFLSFGGELPSKMGAFDIIRLTGAGQLKGSTGDYQSLKQGIQALEFERVDKKRPLYDPENLHAAAVRLMVVKKNGSRLHRLVRDLRKIGPQYMSQVPALIVDDESDQASINTIKPDKKFLSEERRRRSTINQRLTELLSILPRAQYVGYTATPFANVLVDPSDTEGIYPKDFIISLPRPKGYMGVADFHDLVRDGDELVAKVFTEIERTPANSNMAAHVRSVTEPHSTSTEKLRDAIDTFVLTGSIKLWREKHGVLGDFTHHTMLVHESQFTDDQEELAELICDIWSTLGYDGGGGRSRLQALLENDILPTSLARAADLPIPRQVKEIDIELGEVLHRIDSDLRPVLIVNGEKDADTPNFDKIPVWKILVGGAKLSRGYTVEGLTVSYFRRRATYQDTLMQMGRWFGFRPGYRDLVRLYIGRHEPLTAAERRFIDLYSAFEAICVDEESFRRQIAEYAMPKDGSKPLTPGQVPLLVTNSHPQLKPAATNRMYNAELKSRNFGGQWIERTLLSDTTADLKHNAKLMERLVLEAQDFLYRTIRPKKASGPAPGYVGLVSHSLLVDTLSEYVWAKPFTNTLLHLELQFLRGDSEFGDPEIDDWVLYMPQVNSDRCPWEVNPYTFSTVERSRVDSSGRFKAFSEPRHRRVAEVITGVSDDEIDGEGAEFSGCARRGALLLYPTFPFEKDEPDWPDIPAMGMAILPPPNSHPRRLAWSVRDPSRRNDPIISRS